MAKKQKEETTSVNATANRDIIQRLNFLYQASVYLQSVAPSSTLNTKGKERELEAKCDKEKATDTMGLDADRLSWSTNKATKKTKVQRKKTTGDLARTYVQCMRVVGQKTTVKIDPGVKRSLCSSCSSALIPGSSASIRVKRSSNHGHIMIYTCLHCNTTKRIPAPPNGLDEVSLAVAEPTKSTPTSSDLLSPSEGLPNADGHVPATERQPKRLRRTVVSKPLPLFGRPDAGHVVFGGNERLGLDEQSGFGVLFS